MDWASHGDFSVVVELAYDDTTRSFSMLNPRSQSTKPIESARTRTRSTVLHAGEQVQPEVVSDFGIQLLNSLEILDAA